jgi:hypothetical protein
MKAVTLLALAAVIACSSGNVPVVPSHPTPDSGTTPIDDSDAGPPPDAGPVVDSVALPSGADLKPYDSNPSLPRPEGMAYFNGIAYVALANYDGHFAVRGPGLLLAVVPATGATTIIDLGGGDGQQCKESGVVRVGGNLLYVSCAGDFNDLSGTALVEVDPSTNAVTRTASIPTSPTGITVTANKIWVGDAFGGDLYSVDKTTFAVSAMPVNVPCPVGPTPLPSDWYLTIGDVLAVGDNIYTLCSNSHDGVISQLDADTGALKLQADVGPIAAEMAATSDGRIAVISGADNGLRLVTIGSTALTVQKFTPFSNQTSTLQDVRSLDHFLFTTASGSNTVQKLDLNASGGPVVMGEAFMGVGAAPWNVLPLDDRQSFVSNQTANTLVLVKWTK